ncbi:hypothetical protein [uncultured Pseudomonas sp.]|uniref:hypothetical protein n=1 Tax=uncultured Pseudomonas sp. TaxID=114707 RepID=UPI0025E09CD3|nr:hypothetical protein [uncultured Pseudomonas sp.]
MRLGPGGPGPEQRRLDYTAAKRLGLITQELDQLPRALDRATYFITDGAGR